MSEVNPPPEQAAEPEPARDWRGVVLEVGQRIVYVPNKLDALYDGFVHDLKTNWRGAIRIRVVRRNNMNASYTTVDPILWAMPGRITVVNGLPPSPYPSDDEMKATGTSIAAERRKAMSRGQQPRRRTQ